MPNILRLLCFLLLLSTTYVKSQEIVVLNNEHVDIRPLENLNSNFRECNLSIAPNGKELYFMSTRKKPFNNSFGDGDIYKTIYQDSVWMAPEYVTQINTNNGEDEPSVSYDGEKIYFQSWLNYWESSGGPYYEAEIINGKLKNIKGLGGGINQFFRKYSLLNMGYATDGMAVSPDGNLFLVACGADYKGNMDLYFSVKQNGLWTFPELLNVSTSGDERSVYIAADNKTIYFSSDGHGGFGKLDIFKAKWNGINAEGPVNIGQPFNTRKDDRGFVISGRGDAAYFIRDLDIYFANIKEAQFSLKPEQRVLIYGKIQLNNKPAQKVVRIMSEGNLIGETSSDDDGRYSITIPAGFSVAEVFVDDSKNRYHRQTIASNSNLYKEFQIDFLAHENSVLKVDSILKEDSEATPISETDHLHTVIYFEFDTFDIPSEEIFKLKKLLESINQASLVQVIGHTDHVGNVQYNLDLSKKRALSVQHYITEHTGLNKNQFVIKFFGEGKPLNKSNTPQSRSMNRRVYVKIVNH